MIAQQGPPPAQPPGPGPQAGPPPSWAPELTDDQVLKLQALAKEQRDRLRPATEQARKIREDLNAEFWAEKPDEAKIRQLRADLAKAEQEALAARLDFQAKRAQVFTPEQRKQMRARQARQWLQRGNRVPGQGVAPALRNQRLRRGAMPPGAGPVPRWRDDER
jgi:Spy/CpxP family protein refolding chaperone